MGKAKGEEQNGAGCSVLYQSYGGAKHLQHPDPANVLLLGITASFTNVLT